MRGDPMWMIVTWLRSSWKGAPMTLFSMEPVADEEQGWRRLAELNGDGPRHPDPMFVYELVKSWEGVLEWAEEQEDGGRKIERE